MFIGNAISPLITKSSAAADFSKSSVLLDGVDEFIEIDAVQSDLASATVGTFMDWVKPVDATPSGARSIICFGDTNALSEFIIIYLIYF